MAEPNREDLVKDLDALATKHGILVGTLTFGADVGGKVLTGSLLTGTVVRSLPAVTVKKLVERTADAFTGSLREDGIIG